METDRIFYKTETIPSQKDLAEMILLLYSKQACRVR